MLRVQGPSFLSMGSEFGINVEMLETNLGVNAHHITVHPGKYIEVVEEEVY